MLMDRIDPILCDVASSCVARGPMQYHFVVKHRNEIPEIRQSGDGEIHFWRQMALGSPHSKQAQCSGLLFNQASLYELDGQPPSKWCDVVVKKRTQTIVLQTSSEFQSLTNSFVCVPSILHNMASHLQVVHICSARLKQTASQSMMSHFPAHQCQTQGSSNEHYLVSCYCSHDDLMRSGKLNFEIDQSSQCQWSTHLPVLLYPFECQRLEPDVEIT